MEVSDAILKRTSIRKWKQVPVEKEKIVKVLEAGRRAPSWGNTQPWRFIVVQNKAYKEAITKASGGQATISSAPAVVVCCATTEDLSRQMHRKALVQLREAGVTDWSDEFLDNILLNSSVFSPYLLGAELMQVKAGEQVMIAMAYMTLEAVNQGLGTCWVGAITPDAVHKVMNLPDTLFVHSLLPLGYPDEDPKPRPRKKMEEVVFWERYQ